MLGLVILLIVPSVSAAHRLQERSLYINSAVPKATTFYKTSFNYISTDPIGSIDMLFCVDPIPYNPCVSPAGLDVSKASLTEQLGEAGFSITTRSANHLVLSRSPKPITQSKSSYKLDGIVNPSLSNQSFAIRLKTHTSTDASGPLVDFGTIMGQMTAPVEIVTQVPPMLIFCVAEEVSENCTQTNNNRYTDMGDLSSNSTLVAQSQMAVGTNASGGFAITANGTPMAAGTNVIPGLDRPTPSQRGVNQFGINLTANSEPAVGKQPEGEWANAIATPDYDIPDHYKYVPGQVVAYSPSVSLMKKFTVSYIVNSDPNLRAGVYTTTITYIASGRF